MVVECKRESNSKEDMFSKECWMSYHDQNTDQYNFRHRSIQQERAWTMKWGDFHQNLMGSFAGWINYKKGHVSGCDIGKEDGSCVVEIKNNENTMNSSSKSSVMGKLIKQQKDGKRAILVIVNGDFSKKIDTGIEIMNGKEFYKEISGREKFMEDLLSTVKHCFSNFKSFEELQTYLQQYVI